MMKTKGVRAGSFAILATLVMGWVAQGVWAQTTWTVGTYDPDDPSSVANIATDTGDYSNLTNSMGVALLTNGDNFSFLGDDELSIEGDASVFNQIGSVTTQNDKTGSLIIGMDTSSLLDINSLGSANRWLKDLTINSGRIMVHQGIWVDTLDMGIGTNAVFSGNSAITNMTMIGTASAEFFADSRITSLELYNFSNVVFNTSTITDMFMTNNSSAKFSGDSTITNLGLYGGTIIYFEDGVQGTIKSLTGTSGATIELGRNTNLTLEGGSFDGRILRSTGNVWNNSSITKTGDSLLILSGANVHSGGTTISAGTLEALNLRALGDGSVTLDKGAILRIGSQKDRISNSLYINSGTWSGNGNLEMVVSPQGASSQLVLSPIVTLSGATNVKIVGQIEDINRWGGQMIGSGMDSSSLIIAFRDANHSAFIMDSFVILDKNGNRTEIATTEVNGYQRFETSRYSFKYESCTLLDDLYAPGSGIDSFHTDWNMTVAPQDVIIPDISTLMLTNIIGFEIPRAQNVDGPWAKIKGGQLNDGKSMFNHNSYQTLQIGWDKRLDSLTCDKSYWNAGMFFEGDWMYGRGDYRSSCNGVAGNIYGNLSSSTSGVGAGLYLSRTNHQNIYLDVAGRVNLFDNKANMYAQQMPEANNYRTAWASKTLSLAVELGKNFSSKDNRFTLNPYNQVIYVGAPGNKFDVIFADDSIVNVRTDSVDTWTNKLGARAAVNFKNKERVTHMLYGGADYYKGLGGKFTTRMLDTLNPNAQWTTTNAGRPKNDLSYATGTAGFALFPKENIRIATQSDLLFGDVTGWSVSLSGTIGF